MSAAVPRAAAWLAVLALLTSVGAAAHPLPNSLVTLRPGPTGVAIEIDTPAADLAIAMRADRGGENTPRAIGRYYLRHVALADRTGRRLALKVGSLVEIDATDPDVGRYREWRVVLTADASGIREPVTLRFDAVIHQIPNHFALVRLAPASDSEARDVGVVRYDFVGRTVHPIVVDLGGEEVGAGARSGVGAMIAVGFVHVLSGIDHILFLLALLAVVPFLAVDGRWRFAGLDRRAARRFVAISGAFTLGHSASLAAGTFGFDAVPVRLTETLIALSILVAAAHALRPLFARREWMVAGGFGLAHGLAFSEALAGIGVGVRSKLELLFGFNLGVELAQLVVLAAAAPLLAISGRPALARPRQVVLWLIGLAALWWVAARAFGPA